MKFFYPLALPVSSLNVVLPQSQSVTCDPDPLKKSGAPNSHPRYTLNFSCRRSAENLTNITSHGFSYSLAGIFLTLYNCIAQITIPNLPFLPFCPFLFLSVLFCSFLFLFVPFCSFLSLYVPFCPFSFLFVFLNPFSIPFFRSSKIYSNIK